MLSTAIEVKAGICSIQSVTSIPHHFKKQHSYWLQQSNHEQVQIW